MTIKAAHIVNREIESPASRANCSQKREQRGLPIEMPRMMGLQTAHEILGGKRELADALGIGVRSLNHKLNADRGVSNVDMILAAKALEARGRKMLDHARKLRIEVGAGTSGGEPAE